MPRPGDRDYQSYRKYQDKYNERRRAESAAASEQKKKERARMRSKLGLDGICDSNPLKLDDGKGVDWGYVNKWRGAEMEDVAYKKAYPYVKLRSAFSLILGNPPKCGPDDVQTARAQIRRIDEAIDHGEWTRNEWRKLYALRAKWQERAQGKDARYRVVGNKASVTNTERTGWEMVERFRQIGEELSDKGE